MIKERISIVCSKTNKDPGSINIVAVSKNRPREDMEEAVNSGLIDIAENRVQEALLKYKAMSGTGLSRRIKWHMVGHLQTNKIRDAVRIFDLIQSVDSVHLAQEIDIQAAKINKKQDILIQIKTSPEATKFGLEPGNCPDFIAEVSGLKNINIKGLMTIAPLVDNPEEARPYFRQLAQLFEEAKSLQLEGIKLSILSMGMTDDFEIAIQEDSNMVRIGRAIFEG